MNLAVAWWRVIRAVLHLLRGTLICAFFFPLIDEQARLRRVKRWCGQLLRILGIGLDANGATRGGATLVIANHVSWLDILAINAVHPCRFVSKSDVRHWPLIGWLVASGGTLFIERERKRDALRVVHQVADALRQGQTIAVFPEGTTSEGHGLLPFHANLLQAAISTGAPVQPVALRFSDAREAVSQAAAYVGDTHLLRSLWMIVTARGMRVRVDWLPPLVMMGDDRRVVSELLRQRILAALGAEEAASDVRNSRDGQAGLR
jgi:1-acyl-sn-glycerol-3-phosphate acyltransferase